MICMGSVFLSVLVFLFVAPGLIGCLVLANQGQGAPDVSNLDVPEDLQRPDSEAILEAVQLSGPSTTFLRAKGQEYEGEVWLGEPRQPLFLSLDTGKAFSWVLREGAKAGDLPGLTPFSTSRSVSWEPEEGWAQVFVADDKLEIPEIEEDERAEDDQNSDVLARRGYDTLHLSFDLSVPRVPIGVGSSAEGTYPDKFSHIGVVGLGLSSDLPRKISGPRYEPLLQGWDSFFRPPVDPEQAKSYPVIELKPYPPPVFAFFLHRQGGCVQWGAHEPPLYYRPETLQWFPVSHGVTSWTLKLTDILLGDRSLGLCPGGCPAAIHSGQGLISGPPELALKLLRALPVDPMCQDLDLLPELSFVLEGRYRVRFSPEDFAGRRKDPDDPASDQCLGIIAMQQVDAIPGNAWILGAQFMRKVFTVYDRVRGRLGLAEPDPTHFLLNRCDYSGWGVRIKEWRPVRRPSPQLPALGHNKDEGLKVALLGAQTQIASPLDAQLRSGVIKILDEDDPIDRIALGELDGRSELDETSLLEASFPHGSSSWTSSRRGEGFVSQAMESLDRRIESAERALRPYLQLEQSRPSE